MNHRNTARGRSRDLGIPGANGKGSADRVTDTAAYAVNYDAIDWGRKGPEVFAETDGEWVSPTKDLIRE